MAFEFSSRSHCDGECTSGNLHSSCVTSNHPFPERFCQDVSDRTHWHGTVPAVHQNAANGAPLLELPHWARLRPLPQRTRLVENLNPASMRVRWFHGSCRNGLPPEITGARATEVGLRFTPSRLVSLASMLLGGFWAATYLKVATTV